MKKSSLLKVLTAVLFASVLWGAQPAKAQWTVFDPANLAQAVESFVKLRNQLQTAKAQLDHMKYTARKLQDPNFRDIRGMQRQMDAALRSAEGLAYSMERMDEIFRTTFPGETLPDDVAEAISTRQRRLLGTMQGTLRSLRDQSLQLQSARSDVDAFKRQLRSINTAQQAAELQGTIDAFQVEEMMLLRQSILAQTNQQALMNAHRINQQMQSRALLQRQAENNERSSSKYEPLEFGPDFANF